MHAMGKAAWDSWQVESIVELFSTANYPRESFLVAA
jgi:hypothetical protein